MHVPFLLLQLAVAQAAPQLPPEVAQSAPVRMQSDAIAPTAAQAQAVVTQAFAASPGNAPLPSSSSGSPFWAAGVLLALGGGALALHRRKVTALPGRLTIQERISLGPKRMLALAQWGNEQLLLGVSEAGITLLKSQPAEGPVLLEELMEDDGPSIAPAFKTPFEELLGDLPEDAALRAKLRAGNSGRVG